MKNVALEINLCKRKVMMTNIKRKDGEIKDNSEKVQEFVYLGVMMSNKED